MINHPKEPILGDTTTNDLSKHNMLPVVQELITRLQKNPILYDMLEKSIKMASSKINFEEKNKVKNINEYILFINNYVLHTPDQLTNSDTVSKQDMLDGICYFYFLIDQPLEDLKNSGLFKNSIQYYPIFQEWLLQYVVTIGEYLDTDKSWNNQYYNKIVQSGEFNMNSGWYEKGNIWRTFNEWFSRTLSSPSESHPISNKDDNSIVTSPADSVPQGVWKINDIGELNQNVKVKLLDYKNIHVDLLQGSKYANEFANGTLTHAFLNVNDYHRYHYPLSGEVIEHHTVTRGVTLSVTWSEQQKKFIPNDSLGWQYKQTHAYAILKTEKYGLVALIPMGMAQVSSCNLTWPILGHHNKGEGLGNFLFGGSDFMMLFQSNVNFTMMAPKNHDGTYKHILMGEKYGKLSII
jgi:phosphatidylserine decarboxylase